MTTIASCTNLKIFEPQKLSTRFKLYVYTKIHTLHPQQDPPLHRSPPYNPVPLQPPGLYEAPGTKTSFTLPQSDMVKLQQNHQKKPQSCAPLPAFLKKKIEVNQQINNVATDRLLPWAPASEESCHFQRSMRHIGLR